MEKDASLSMRPMNLVYQRPGGMILTVKAAASPGELFLVNSTSNSSSYYFLEQGMALAQCHTASLSAPPLPMEV
jgi:hypothetical protein